MLQAHAPSMCPKHSGQAMLQADATRICTDGRTDGLTKTFGHLAEISHLPTRARAYKISADLKNEASSSHHTDERKSA